MKLLTPQQNKDIAAHDQIRDLMRTQELQKAAGDARMALANAEVDFNETLARNRSQWAVEEEEHEVRKEAMKREIDELEAKKLNALIPLGILKYGVYDRMADATTFLSDLRLREERVDELTERLEDQLDTTGQREQDALRLEQTLNSQKEGIALQQEQTRAGVKALNDAMTEFNAHREKTQKELAERATAIDLLDRGLEAREEQHEHTRRSLDQQALKIADDRQTLQDAWDELERKRQKLSL